MKILVIQLARLGDIFQTWPTLKALGREFSDGELHLMVREKFAPACEALDGVDQIKRLDTRHIFEPSFQEEADLEESVHRISEFIEDLRGEGYDRIVNLTFSPFSSFLTEMISKPEQDVRGYTRHEDDFLAMPDEVSAYFFAQVGIGRGNRFHVSDLFSGVAGVELQAEDWQTGAFAQGDVEDHVVIHIGASQKEKSVSPEKWSSIISKLLRAWDGKISLIGSPDESELAATVVRGCSSDRLVNLVGETKVKDLFGIIQSSCVLVGCDSGPIHIASLTQTPVLNLSFSSVNFWETGPKSPGSRIIVVEKEDELPSDRVAREVVQLINGDPPTAPLVLVGPYDQEYINQKEAQESLSWQFVKSLYLGQDVPKIEDVTTLEGLLRMREANALAMEQFEKLKENPQNELALRVLRRCDEMFVSIATLVPDLNPILRWLEASKARIGPVDLDQVVTLTQQAHERLEEFCWNYFGDFVAESMEGDARGNDTMVAR